MRRLALLKVQDSSAEAGLGSEGRRGGTEPPTGLALSKRSSLSSGVVLSALLPSHCTPSSKSLIYLSSRFQNIRITPIPKDWTAISLSTRDKEKKDHTHTTPRTNEMSPTGLRKLSQDRTANKMKPQPASILYGGGKRRVVKYSSTHRLVAPTNSRGTLKTFFKRLSISAFTL